MPRQQLLLSPVLVLISAVVAVVSSLGAPLVAAVTAACEVTAATAQWTLTLPYLVAAVSTPLLGHLGDGRLRRTTIIGTLLLVMVGCILAALPLGFGWLLAGRGLSGLGLGLMPLVIAVARSHLSAQAAPRTITALSVTTAAGIGVAFPAAGLLADLGGPALAHGGGAAVAAVACALAAAVIPSPAAGPRRPLDVPGLGLLAVTVGSLVLALGQAERWGWWSAPILLTTALSLSALALLVRNCSQRANPVVTLEERSVAANVADASAVLACVAMFVLFTCLLLRSQAPRGDAGLGLSALQASLLLAPFSAMSLVAAGIAPRVVRRLSVAGELALGAALYAAAFCLFLVRSDVVGLLGVALVGGLGMGLTFAAMPALIMQGGRSERTASALGFHQLMRVVGSAAGSAVGGAVIAARTPAGASFPDAVAYHALAAAAAFASLAVCAMGILVHRSHRRRGEVDVPESEPTVTPPSGY